MNNIYLENEEKAIFALRSLYRKYGYMPYKMCKFEEYDLYLKNKDFLISDNIITFTDTDGRLMALKPDVTLSIIKNLGDVSGSVQKVYYNENVYRLSKGSNSFKEIMQSGLECIGAIDDYTIYEVLMLASESLNLISKDYVIDISHLGIVSSIIDTEVPSADIKKQVINCIAEKNLSELCAIEKRENIDLSKVKELNSTYGSLEKVLPFLESLPCKNETAQLIKILTMLEKNGYKGKIRVDFSIISDMKYYNGFLFKGFINGIPTSVLSGGQYDSLMKKMKRDEKAIGFAVYLDMLEFLYKNSDCYDADTVILYDVKTDIDSINDAARHFSKDGGTVMVQRNLPEKARYKQIVKVTEGGVKILENNA
ncbi:MAG: ATP phosphoribosyltransferase regulatory subunit [Firmicutes bacterium]|nr:ATP phosphoribosyltransferase regulatory subunit [Bacillota bacterium]